MGRVLLGIILGILLVPIAALGYLKFGRMPVAVADEPLPMEDFATRIPLKTRIEFEQVTNPPVKPGEDTFTAGAHIYAQECAVCHGFHGKASRFGMHMAPQAPLLWEKNIKGDAVGVSNQELGAIYWKVENGIRLTGMPAFKDVLTPLQRWQVSTLLANANKPLPPTALALLKGETLEDAPNTNSGTQAAGLTAPAGTKFEVKHQPN
jgi:mono/diheme cytochrome c family protein